MNSTKENAPGAQQACSRLTLNDAEVALRHASHHHVIEAVKRTAAGAGHCERREVACAWLGQACAEAARGSRPPTITMSHLTSRTAGGLAATAGRPDHRTNPAAPQGPPAPALDGAAAVRCVHDGPAAPDLVAQRAQQVLHAAPLHRLGGVAHDLGVVELDALERGCVDSGGRGVNMSWDKKKSIWSRQDSTPPAG